MNVLITQSKERISIADLDDVEDRVGMRLPQQYQQFLLRHNGGKPEPARFVITEDGRETFSSVDQFLAIYDGPHDNLLRYWEIYEGRIPEGLLPIAHDAGGNLICVSCAIEDNGTIYFWDHEQEGDEGATSPISSNLEEFLCSLIERN